MLVSASWLISILFLTRTVLIIIGLLKDPILRQFERYGNDESFFQLVTPLLGWMGIFVVTSNLLLTLYWGYSQFLMGFGVLLIGLAVLSYEYPQWVGQPYGLFFTYPHWLYEISQRTTRWERRRLAYMWLRLPWRLRMIYNGNTRAFMEWADMVILSTWVNG